MQRSTKVRSLRSLARTILATTLILAMPASGMDGPGDACAGYELPEPGNLAPRDQVAALAGLVDQRLSYMDDVAAYKWVKGLPIEDLERERVVMADSLKNAARHELEPNSVRSFFELQIALAKSVQAHWFRRWDRTSFGARDIPDLPGQIRPELLRLGDEILGAVADLEPWRLPGSCLEALAPVFIRGVTNEIVSADEKQRLFRSIRTIRPQGARSSALSQPDVFLTRKASVRWDDHSIQAWRPAQSGPSQDTPRFPPRPIFLRPGPSGSR